MEPRSTQFLFQRLSIAIQRENAASVVGTASMTAAVTIFVMFQCTVNLWIRLLNLRLLIYSQRCCPEDKSGVGSTISVDLFPDDS